MQAQEPKTNERGMGEHASTSDVAWTDRDRYFMEEALNEAESARLRGEVPVGCVFVYNGEIIARGSNQTNETRNGTRHAELVATDTILSAYGREKAAEVFRETDLYVTVEPCIMCAGALSILGLRRAFYGCPNDKFGGNGSVMDIASRGCGSCGGGTNKRAFTYTSRGGLLASEAVDALKRFYEKGNPAAPKPHRRVVRDEVKAWTEEGGEGGAK